MIGIVVRELTYLKILQPIMWELSACGAKYMLFYMDAPRGDKEYNRATLDGLKKSSSIMVSNAEKLIPYANDERLISLLVENKITKFVTIETWLTYSKWIPYLKQNNIKLYNILYFTDSMWQEDKTSIQTMDRVYYTTEYLMNKQLEYIKENIDINRDKTFGSPVFDQLFDINKKNNNLMLLVPSIFRESYQPSFGSDANYIKIIKTVSNYGDIIIKSRKKHYHPSEANSMAKEIFYDTDVMYPSSIQEVFKKTDLTVMFYSTGIFEAVLAGNYVVNIDVPVKTWTGDKDKLEVFFSKNHDLFNYPGVVETVNRDDILSGTWKIENKLDQSKRAEWIKKFIGSPSKNSAKLIAEDIYKS